MKLFYRLILRPLARDRLRSALTILSVALGVAVIVAIDLAGDAATGSFRSSMETLTGRTDLEILANGGIDERYFGALTKLAVDAKWSPVMVGQAVLPGAGAIPLYGVDLLGKEALDHRDLGFLRRGQFLAVALAVEIGGFAALFDHFLKHFGDEQVVVRRRSSGPKLDIAVLDGRLDKADRARCGLVSAFHGGDESCLDVVADHAIALAVHFGPDQR